MAFRKSNARARKLLKFSGINVLLVEDTRLYSFAIRRELEDRFGLNVFHCPTMAAARLELEAGQTRFHLAILDLCQPDAPDGEALDLVIDRAIPAIVFSALGSDAKREQILAKGVSDIVAKSTEEAIDNLSASVDRFLSLGRPSVLICDPAIKATSPLVRSVQAANFLVTLAGSTDEALNMLDASQAIELVLVPGPLAAADAYSFIDTVRNRFGEDTVRVIGYGNPKEGGDIAAFLKAGGDDFLRLPINAAELEGRLTHSLTIHRQIQLLKRMASRDYLTDLLNRRYFFDRGPKIVDMCLRQGLPACTALIDIDHFKRLNDNYGHEVGDQVLKAVSRRLMSLVGDKHHLLARLGGEEFGILFANVDISTAFEFCERIRRDIARIRIAVDDEDISVTISMGLAKITGAESFDNYLNAADQYLYLAKHSGRNRVFSDYQVERIAQSCVAL